MPSTYRTSSVCAPQRRPGRVSGCEGGFLGWSSRRRHMHLKGCKARQHVDWLAPQRLTIQ